MHRGEVFWGGLLVLLGVLFFLRATGVLTGDVFSWFWPLFFIACGMWVLADGVKFHARYENAENFSVPLQTAREGSLLIVHGVGRIELRSGANAGDFITGMVGVGMNRSTHMDGDKLEVKIAAGPTYIPFIGPEGGVWQFRLNPDLPTSIKIGGGASRLDLDLSDLQVTYFSFDGGASNLHLTLPARVENSLVEIEAGAASINLDVPDGVALRLRTKSVGSLHIDETRFPRRDVAIYQSADYDTAKYHVEVTVDGGATSIKVGQV